MKELKYFFSLLFLLVAPLIEAQQVDVIALMLYKDFKEVVKKDRLEIGLLIRDTANIVSLNTNNSKLIKLIDDTGENLFVEENGKKQAFINARDTRIIAEGLIFQIESNRIPSKEAENIHIKAALTYKVVDSQQSELKHIKNVNFQTLDTISWFNNKVKVFKSNYNDSRKGAMIWYEFKSDDLDVIIEKIEATNLEEKIISEINFSRYPDSYRLSLPTSKIRELKNLKITYKKCQNKIIKLDQKFGIGL